MPIQTSSTATAGRLTQYEAKYMEGALEERTYDQLANPVGKTFEPKGLTVSRQWLVDALPRPTAAVGSETTDFEPQMIRDVSASFNKIYLADGISAHDLVFLESSLLDEKTLAKATGQLAMMTIDALARRKATEADLVIYGGSTQVSARGTLDLGTPGHRFGLDCFTIARAIMGSFAHGEGLMCVIDDFQYADLMNTSGSVVTSALEYNEKGLETLFNYEMGELAGVRIIVSPHAKAFYGAGVANASVVNTTIAASVGSNNSNVAGATTIEVASNTNIAAGGWLTLGTIQSAGESDDTLKTEIVRVGSVNGTTITVVGKGRRNGLKWDHGVGSAVTNADTAHCAVFGSSKSLVVAFEKYGRYGQLIPAFNDGHAKQWTNFSFSPN